VYCTRVLHLSEHAAYSRIEAARAARRYPHILELLVDGNVTLTTITLLTPHLTDENWRAVLAAACHTSQREVEGQVAALRPLPPVPSAVRKLPVRRPIAAGVATAERRQKGPEHSVAAGLPDQVAKPAVVKPLAPEHYKVQFTISRETHEKLRRAQDLLRHSIPDGDPAKIFGKALTLLLADVERKKVAAALKPRNNRPAQTESTRYSLRG
jgi:hypothetical protein